MKYWVYVLQSTVNGHFYKGMTTNIDRRIKEHNSGKTKSTKAHGPWVLFYSEVFDNIEDARKKEIFLKSGSGREFIKELRSRSSIG